MKVKLIKEYKIGKKVKSKGVILEVTNGLGEKLISDGIAEKFTTELKELPKTNNKKATKITEKNSNFTNNKEVEKPLTNNDK